MSAAQEQVVLLARKNAEERVASFLLSLVRRMGRSSQSPCIAVELPMTRLDMADYLGLTIETVSRVFTRLAKRGYIATAARHEVTILRPTALALLAVDDQEDDRDDVEIAWAS
jgi:CRP/FNR family transcriptional regulator